MLVSRSSVPPPPPQPLISNQKNMYVRRNLGIHLLLYLKWQGHRGEETASKLSAARKMKAIASVEKNRRNQTSNIKMLEAPGFIFAHELLFPSGFSSISTVHRNGVILGWLLGPQAPQLCCFGPHQKGALEHSRQTNQSRSDPDASKWSLFRWPCAVMARVPSYATLALFSISS